MVDNKEKLRVRSHPEKKSHAEHKEIKETRIVKEGASEVLHQTQSAEQAKEAGAEFVEGHVGEMIREDKKKGPAGKGGHVRTNDEIEAIRARLLQNIPPQAIMVKQIKRRLYGEEKRLTKEFKKYSRKGADAAFQLTIVVAQLRKIREYFSILASATFELIKHLWLKIVHGV